MPGNPPLRGRGLRTGSVRGRGQCFFTADGIHRGRGQCFFTGSARTGSVLNAARLSLNRLSVVCDLGPCTTCSASKTAQHFACHNHFLWVFSHRHVVAASRLIRNLLLANELRLNHAAFGSVLFKERASIVDLRFLAWMTDSVAASAERSCLIVG